MKKTIVIIILLINIASLLFTGCSGSDSEVVSESEEPMAEMENDSGWGNWVSPVSVSGTWIGHTQHVVEYIDVDGTLLGSGTQRIEYFLQQNGGTVSGRHWVVQLSGPEWSEYNPDDILGTYDYSTGILLLKFGHLDPSGVFWPIDWYPERQFRFSSDTVMHEIDPDQSQYIFENMYTRQ